MATKLPEVHIAAHGKLLLSGEYFVLDGALALAVPTRLGQVFKVMKEDASTSLSWRSRDERGEIWFEGVFDPEKEQWLKTTEKNISDRLSQIIKAVLRQRPDFLPEFSGAIIETSLEFPRTWGLGTSSTLVSALARWSETNPFQLLADTFGGSGYDLACAFANGPILYQRHPTGPHFVSFPFLPSFQDKLFLVYLGKKQNSREGIARYREKVKGDSALVTQVSELTASLVKASDLKTFGEILEAHESLISEALGMEKVKEIGFVDYWGSIKSLGAWGGDFVLVTSDRSAEETRKYFQKKGLATILTYQELIL